MYNIKNVEPIRYKEISPKFFGKLYISYNGAIALFRREEDYSTVEDDLGTFAVAEIPANDNCQRRWADISILDATIARVHLELCTVTTAWKVTTACKVTGNCPTYQDDVLPIVAPFCAFIMASVSMIWSTVS